MDFSNPRVLGVGLLLSVIGTGLFIHGKRAGNPRSLSVGIALCVFPMFVHSVAMMLGIGAACIAGLYALNRYT